MRAKRPKQDKPEPQPAAPLTVECPWPWKDAHPEKATARQKLKWLKAHDASYRTAEAYRCVTADGHYHLGNPRVPAERGRKERYRREEEEAA